MNNLESPEVAEDKQRRKAQFMPPVWPLLAIIAIAVVVAVIIKH